MNSACIIKEDIIWAIVS